MFPGFSSHAALRKYRNAKVDVLCRGGSKMADTNNLMGQAAGELSTLISIIVRGIYTVD